MGVSDASISYKKLNNITPGNPHYISFDSSKIIWNEYYSKNLKEVISSNTERKNNQNLNIVNSKVTNNNPNIKNNNNNLLKAQKKKLSYLKSTNISKTVDKKLSNNINKSNIYNDTNNDNNNSTNKKNFSYLRENSKNYLKLNDKNIKNINNNNYHINKINTQNNNSKEVIPFYYKPKKISKTSKENTNNHKSNFYNNDLSKNKKNNILFKTKSKENLNSKIINNNMNTMTGIDIHRSFNNISRISPSDKLNIINNNMNKKINYKIDHIVDIHNYLNNIKNKPIYLIDDINNNLVNKNNEKKYSNENDFNNIIRYNKDNSNNLKIYIELLKLKERKWQEEMININKLISNNRMPKNKSNNININYILQRIIILYDHFNWLIDSIGFIYNLIIYENKKEIINNYGKGNISLPPFDSNIWFKGFKWKGLYIRIDKNIDSKNIIKKEIKALNYLFFDYLHIIWNDNIIEDYEINNNILSNNIIFPLIGYCQIKSFIMIVSLIIKPEKNNNINYIDIFEKSKGIVEFYSKINILENNIFGNKIKNSKYLSKYNFKVNIKKHNNNIDSININDFNKNKYINNSIDFNNKGNKKTYNMKNKNALYNNINNINNKNNNDISYFKESFYIKDILKSKLFSEINRNNLIKVKGGKYILVNISNLIPNLFENKFSNNIKKINFFGVVNGEKKYYTLNYNFSFNINIDNILNINFKCSNHNNENEILDNNTPQKILEKIYNIYPSTNMKFQSVKIGNIFFLILYFNFRKSKINSKKCFVDLLYNYIENKENNDIFDMKKNQLNENNNNKKEFTYIQEPYVIIYDIIDPIKLDYSLIKSVKMKDNQTEIIKNLFFLRTNYVEYFLHWCDIFNKNSYNIKRYQDLKYYMKKYGINQNLLLFSLIKINNKEITDIIKIHLLVKIFKFICYQKDNEIVLNEIKSKQKNNNNQEINFNINDNLKSDIIFYIKSIIYPNELLPIGQKKFKYIYEQLLFYTNILFFRYKLIDDYLSLGLLNNNKNINNNNSLYSYFNIQSPNTFLKHIILRAREKPFLFISEMEYKLNFIIDPFIKFKCSISLESMSHQLDVMHVNLTNNITKSFVNSDEISGLILSKIIQKYKDDENNIINEKINLNSDLKNNIYRGNENNKKKNDLIYDIKNSNNDYISLNNKPAVLNTKVNILSIKNKIKNNKDLEEDKITNFEDENENTHKNDDNKSNMSNININSNNNSQLLLRNNSHDNTNIYNNSNDVSNIDNIDNNEIVAKISNDKTMEESESTKIQISNKATNSDINSKQNLQNCVNHCKINSNSQNLNNKNFKDIYENINFFLPPICYKILYNFENNKESKDLFHNLKQNYYIKNIQILKEWVANNENIFKNINNSYNSNCEYALMKSYIYYFLFSYYIELNKKEATKINNKLISLFKKNFSYQLTLNDLAIINLTKGLLNNNYIENEEYFSKCVMLLLLNYGDPRGRNNDSHEVMQFPLWEISRKTYKLEEPFINENFKEMYQALDFFNKRKGIFILSKNKIENKYNFNYMNNIIKNVEKIKLMNINIKKSNNVEMNDSESIYSMVNNIDENPNENFINKDLTDKNISLSHSIFDKTILEKTCIKHNIFPSISCKSPNVSKVFFRKEFIIYIIKQIQSLLMGRGVLLNKNFIDKKISDDIILNNLSLNKENIGNNPKNNNFSETPLKFKYINKFDREKQLENSSSKTNPYFEIDKKYNNRNTQYLPKNSQIFNSSNISKSYNNSIRTSNELNSSNISKNKSDSNSNNKISNRQTLSNNGSHNNKIKKIHINQKTKKLFSHFLYNELFQKLSYKKNLPSGIIISFGNNSHNETSHDRYEKLTLPRVIFKLKNEMINNIYSGWEHNIVLNNKGEIFSFGHNQNYQCGLPNIDKNTYSINNENINDPTNISIIYNNLKAIKASCGNEHSLILSQDNNVYGFGNNEYGLLGIPDKKIKIFKPTKINFSDKNGNEEYSHKIKNISCGTLHNLALTDNGNIFSWGSFQGGQLGLSSDLLLNKNNDNNDENNLFLTTPTLIPYFENNKIIIEKISCGEAHSLALSNKGKVYSWGFGSNGQLGLGICEDIFEPGQGLLKSRFFEPQLIKTYKEYNNINDLNKTNNNINNISNNVKIKDIECGKTFSMFINNKNNLYACGINDLKQLGFKDIEPKDNLYNPEIQCDDYIYPSLLRCFENKKVEKISCGEGHCLAIVNDLNSNLQSIWSWGNNKFGQLGHGSMIKITVPKEIDYLTEYNKNIFCDVSCGGFHSLCLLKSKNNLDWIEKDYNESILEIIEEIGDL